MCLYLGSFFVFLFALSNIDVMVFVLSYDILFCCLLAYSFLMRKRKRVHLAGRASGGGTVRNRSGNSSQDTLYEKRIFSKKG